MESLNKNTAKIPPYTQKMGDHGGTGQVKRFNGKDPKEFPGWKKWAEGYLITKKTTIDLEDQGPPCSPCWMGTWRMP